MPDPRPHESDHAVSRPYRKQRGAEQRRRVGVQNVGAARLHLAKTSGLGIGPVATTALDDRSCRGAMGGALEPCAAIP